MKQHVNLLTQELVSGERWLLRPAALPGAFIAVLVLILAGTALEGRRSQTLKTEISLLTDRRASLEGTLASVRSEVEELFIQNATASGADRATERLFEDLARQRSWWAEMVREIGLVVPEQVWLIRFQGDDRTGGKEPASAPIPGRKVRFEGFAGSHRGITRMMTALERSKYFDQVVLIYAEKDAEQGQARVKFEMTAILKQGGSHGRL